jgi:hypothetical protein
MLEHDLTKLLETNQLLGKEVSVTKQQLHLKEDEFVKSKTQLESVNQELSSAKKDLEERVTENLKLQSKIKDLQVKFLTMPSSFSFLSEMTSRKSWDQLISFVFVESVQVSLN